jgi:hypothetical protein
MGSRHGKPKRAAPESGGPKGETEGAQRCPIMKVEMRPITSIRPIRSAGQQFKCLEGLPELRFDPSRRNHLPVVGPFKSLSYEWSSAVAKIVPDIIRAALDLRYLFF